MRVRCGGIHPPFARSGIFPVEDAVRNEFENDTFLQRFGRKLL